MLPSWVEIGEIDGPTLDTPVIIYLAYRSMREWVMGDLSCKSVAAIA